MGRKWKVGLKDGREVTLQLLKPSDKENLLMMFSTMTEDALKWALPPYGEEWIDRKLKNIPNMIPLVAFHDSNIVGFSTINKHHKERRRGIGDMGIFLHQVFHNVGLGTAMTKRLLALAVEQGLHRIQLEVIEGNKAAVRLYEKVGFRVEGKMRDAFFRAGEYHDSLLMAIILKKRNRSDNHIE
jgi:putative acetyltransferase